MFGPKQLIDVLSRLVGWTRPARPKKPVYELVSTEGSEGGPGSDPECGQIKFDKTPFYSERAKTRALRAAEKAAKTAERKCCRGTGSAFLIFGLLVSLLLALVYIGRLHSSPGCALGGAEAAAQLANALKSTLTSTQEQLQSLAGSILGRPDGRTLLIGVVTKADEMQKRATLREVYSPVKPPGVDVLFVFPRQEDPSLGLLLELEAQKFGDIVILNETMSNEDGLAFAWFKAAALRVPKLMASQTRNRNTVAYSYVMKAEDETFLHLPNLLTYFQTLPAKQHTYWGRFLDDGSGAASAAFAISWDLVDWIGYSVPGLLSARMGAGSPHMKSVLDLHGGVNWSSAKLEEWYDSPLSGDGGWAHEYTNQTLVIRGTNDTTKLLDAAKYFYGALYEEHRLTGL